MFINNYCCYICYSCYTFDVTSYGVLFYLLGLWILWFSILNTTKARNTYSVKHSHSVNPPPFLRFGWILVKTGRKGTPKVVQDEGDFKKGERDWYPFTSIFWIRSKGIPVYSCLSLCISVIPTVGTSITHFSQNLLIFSEILHSNCNIEGDFSRKIHTCPKTGKKVPKLAQNGVFFYFS